MRPAWAVLAGALVALPAHARLQAQPGDTSLAPVATTASIARAIATNDLTAADAAIAAAVARYPNDPALHNLAGVVRAQRGDFSGAESQFLTAIRLAPRSPGAYTNLGRLYQERSAADPASRAKALAIYQRLLGIDPAHREGLFQASLLLALDGRFADSRALLERLPAEVRATPQVLALTAVALDGSGDASGARAAAAALAAHPRLAAADVVAVSPAFAHLRADERPLALYEALDRRSLATPDMLQRLAAIHMAHARYPEARAVLERAAAAGATAPVLIDLARAAFKQGDRKGALGYLAHARSLEPENARVHFLFGIVCVELDLGGEAYESLKKAVALDPQNPLANYAMGAVATGRRDASEAIPYFETYVRLAPDDPRGRFALGAARYYSQQLEEARRDLSAAARSPHTAAGAHYFLARIARQFDDLVTARREIDRTVALAPGYADAWAERGLIDTRAGRYAEAESALTKALAIDPDNYDATRHLAALYGRTRDPRRADVETRLAALIEQRARRAQDFLRLVEAVP